MGFNSNSGNSSEQFLPKVFVKTVKIHDVLSYKDFCNSDYNKKDDGEFRMVYDESKDKWLKMFVVFPVEINGTTYYKNVVFSATIYSNGNIPTHTDAFLELIGADKHENAQEIFDYFHNAELHPLIQILAKDKELQLVEYKNTSGYWNIWNGSHDFDVKPFVNILDPKLEPAKVIEAFKKCMNRSSWSPQYDEKMHTEEETSAVVVDTNVF